MNKDKELNENQIASTITEFIASILLEKHLFQNNVIPMTTLFYITNDFIKSIQKEQTEKFNLYKELSILYKEVVGKDLTDDEKKYNSIFHKIDPLEEMVNGIKYAMGFSFIKNFSSTLFSSISNKLYNHIPYILGYTGLDYLGPLVVSKVITKTLDKFKLQEKQKEVLTPWLNVVGRLALRSATPRISSTEEGEILYQFPSDKKKMDIYGSNGKSQIYGDEHLTEISIRNITAPEGKEYPAKDIFSTIKLDGIHHTSEHTVEMLVTNQYGKKVSVLFSKREDGQGLMVHSSDKELETEWSNYLFNIKTVEHAQTESERVPSIDQNHREQNNSNLSAPVDIKTFEKEPEISSGSVSYELNHHIFFKNKTGEFELSNEPKLIENPSVKEEKTEVLSIPQNLIIDALKEMGIPLANEIGDCYGISLMATQAYLAKDLDAFSKRIIKIAQLDRATKSLVRDLIHKEVPFEEIKSKTGVNLTDFSAFSMGVNLYQAPDKYSNLLDKFLSQSRIDEVIPIVSPVLLEKDPMIKVDSFSGEYNHTDLTIYIREFRNVFEKENNFALVLTSINHAIHIHYDKDLKKWILIDPNNLPGIQINNDEEMAIKISEAFLNKPGECTLFSTYVYSKQSCSKSVSEEFLKVTDHSVWKDIHHPMTKGKEKDGNGATWLFLAAQQGDTNAIKALLKNPKINPNISFHLTPLHYAILNGHVEVARLLLNDPRVNPNIQFKSHQFNGMILYTILDEILKNPEKLKKGVHGQILKLLLNHPDIDLDQKMDKKTTLFEAIKQIGDSEIMDLFVQRQQNQNKHIGIAIKNSNIDTVKELLKNEDIDMNQTYLGKPLLEVAVENRSIPIFELLLNHPRVNVSQTNLNLNPSVTLLHVLVRDFHAYPFVKLLLKHPNVDPNRETRMGTTPLDVAIENINVEHGGTSMRTRKSMAMVKLLLDHPKIDLNKVNPDRLNYLFLLAVKTNDVDNILQSLLNYPKLDPETIKSALSIALENAEYEEKLGIKKGKGLNMVRLLLTDPRINPDIGTVTPMIHIANEHDDTQIAKPL